MPNFRFLTTTKFAGNTTGCGVFEEVATIVKKIANFVELLTILTDSQGNDTCHASHKNGAPRRVFYFLWRGREIY
jgi:hypothetical protein